MGLNSKAIRKEILPGPTITVGEQQVTPLAKVYRVGISRKRWGVVWGMPEAVILKTPEGSFDIMKIYDRTRTFRINLVIICLLPAAIGWLILRERKNIADMG